MLPDALNIKYDCLHYRGAKPCKANQLCGGCQHYETYQSRICIIKIGAFGDVIRTTSILPALHEKYPNAQVTWVTQPSATRLLCTHPQIHRLIEFNTTATLPLLHEQFDLVICLDKEPEPCALAMQVNTQNRIGVGLSPVGTPIPLNTHAESYFYLGLSDDLKFHQNQKSYSQLVHEALDLPYTPLPYHLQLDEKVDEQIDQRLTESGWNPHQPTLGINVGAGNVFANKSWTPQQLSNYISTFHEQSPQTQILLLGGPSESEILTYLHQAHPFTINTGHQNTEHEFLSLIDHCDTLFTGDTMAMHLGIAREKGIVAFFGPTCHQEIDLFGLGEKLIATPDCAPCYKRVCDHQNVCLKEISITHAVSTTLTVLNQSLSRSRVIKLNQFTPINKAS